jgi:hypothetical protein
MVCRIGAFSDGVLNDTESIQLHMDTATYASIAVIPWSIAESNQHLVITELRHLDLSYISQ